MKRRLAECVALLEAKSSGDDRLRGWLSHLWLTQVGVVISLSRKTDLSDLEVLIEAGRTAPHFRELTDTPWLPQAYTTDLPDGLVFADADELYVASQHGGGVRVCSSAEVEKKRKEGMQGIVQWVMTAEIRDWDDADKLPTLEEVSESVQDMGEQTSHHGDNHPKPLEGTPPWFLSQLFNPSDEPDWELLRRWSRRIVFHRSQQRYDRKQVCEGVAWSIREFLRENWQRFRVRLPAGLETMPFDELVDSAENWVVDARAKHPAKQFSAIGATPFAKSVQKHSDTAEVELPTQHGENSQRDPSPLSCNTTDVGGVMEVSATSDGRVKMGDELLDGPFNEKGSFGLRVGGKNFEFLSSEKQAFLIIKFMWPPEDGKEFQVDQVKQGIQTLAKHAKWATNVATKLRSVLARSGVPFTVQGDNERGVLWWHAIITKSNVY